MKNKGEAQAALDERGIEWFCDRISEGDGYRAIAKILDISPSCISRWLAKDAERSARAREALRESAYAADDKAEEVLLDKNLDPAIRRELAFHYRWRARVRDPRQYGEKLNVEQTTTVVNLSDEEIDRRMREIQKKLGEEPTT